MITKCFITFESAYPGNHNKSKQYALFMILILLCCSIMIIVCTKQEYWWSTDSGILKKCWRGGQPSMGLSQKSNRRLGPNTKAKLNLGTSLLGTQRWRVPGWLIELSIWFGLRSWTWDQTWFSLPLPFFPACACSLSLKWINKIYFKNNIYNKNTKMNEAVFCLQEALRILEEDKYSWPLNSAGG